TLCNSLLEGGLGNDFSDLPVAGAAPEWMSEKAVSIGFYVVGSGITTFLSNPLPVTGSKKVVKLLCEDLEDIVGAKFIFESDPVKTAKMIVELLDSKREKLKLKPAYS
ncbi:MAG: carbon monoxide dehydrogenase, partial [Ruminiclostridium sp.]|nr:carbon monoxide dehydrogenase [Ruminiclostridium sp.]